MNKPLKLIRSLLLTNLLAMLAPSAVQATELPDFPFVVASGTAETEVAPDKATIRIHFAAFSQSSEAALESVNIASAKLLQLAKKYQIPETSLEAGDLEKQVERKRDKEFNELDILGYQVSRRVKIELQELSRYAALMAEIVAIDNMVRVDSDFDLSTRKEVERRLIAEAGADARAQAEDLAAGLGMKLHSVYAISQVSDFDGFMATFGAASGAVYAAMADRPAEQVQMFVPKTIKIHRQVNAVFRLKH